MREKFSNKRGISPILATLLLIVIAVAAIIITYAWITTYMGGATHQAGASIKFDNAYIDASSGNVTIFVRNNSPSGETVTIDKVYIEGQDVSTYCKVDGGTLPVTLQPNEVVELVVSGSGLSFQAGQYYSVRVSGPETYWEESVLAQ